MSQPKPGDRFFFSYLDEPDSQPHAATVQRILSNRQEGASPEIDLYVDEWIEALPSDLPSDPAASLKSFTVMLGTNNNAYIDGRPISVTFEQSQAP